MLLIRSRRLVAAGFAAIALTWCAPALAAPRRKREEVPARAIGIVINGEELARDPAPRMVHDRVLVPIVRIYAALGIAVARVNGSLVATAPNKRIAIAAGSARATVDNRTVTMEVPATTIDGATYVPLRFVADSLGAQVRFDQRAQRVEVTSLIVGRTPGLEQKTPGGSTQIVGQLSALDLNSVPESVTVTRGGSARTIAITSDAGIVLQDVVTRSERPASLADLHVGDAISVVLRGDGRVARIVARYASRAGIIAAVSGSAFVLQNGYVVTPDKSTTITLNGQQATLGDLKVGDSVTVRLNPDTSEKREVIASRTTPTTPQPTGSTAISGVTIDASRPLRAGDSFTVTLRGTPGGKATFDIGTYATGIAMSETSPGVYTARYTVPAGVNFGRTAVYGHLSVNGKTAPRAEAQQLVAIATSSPQITDIAPSNGQTVNNSRPSIYATFQSPTNVGVNASSVRIEVNHLDVTAAATRTDSFITYTPSVALSDGTVTVDVSLTDNAGNPQHRSWSFTVRTR